MPKISGGCLCGAVRYECNAEPFGTAICHCTHCQKVSGSAFSVNVVVPAPSLTWLGQSLAGLCGQRRERETAFAKVLQELWVITCDRNGGPAGSNNYQGRHSRR